MRRAAVLLVSVGLTLAVWGLTPERGAAEAAAAVAPAASPSPDFVPWIPSESWPGGRQYDPRLERTVRFWGAGMPLREVFEGVKEQTGVEIGFWPPGDMNERVCVTLYLNPEQPPTLRELMAQLSWVTDCGFAVSGEGTEARYELVGRSAAGGVIERVAEDAKRARREREGYRQQLAAEMHERVLARLGEFEEALSLAPEVVASRYRGVDDLIVFAMSDPAMRAAVEFVLSLPEEDLARTAGSFDMDVEVGEWARASHVFVGDWLYMSPEQRALLRTALEPTLELNRRRWNARVGPEHQCPELEWSEDLPLGVEVDFTDVGGFRFQASVADEESAYYDKGLWAEGAFLAVVPPPDVGMLAGDTTIALKRAAGEVLTSEDEYWIRDAFKMALRWREARRSMEQRIAEQEHLSPETVAALGSVPLPLDTHEPYSLWQIQEAAAARSGMHAVSDCFYQFPESLDRAMEVVCPGDAPELTTLAVLRLKCVAWERREAFAEDVLDWSSGLDWEWGDAGTFLRFRSTERDLWRAGFLPEDVVAMVDGWLAPHLPEILEAEGSGREFEIAVDIREIGRLAARLAEPQRRWGGRLTYADPGVPANACRGAFRQHVFSDIAQHGHLLALLGRLGGDEWERLNGEGLRWGVDVSAKPGPEAKAWASWLGAEEGDLVRLVRFSEESVPPGGGGHRREGLRLEGVRDGEVTHETRLRTEVSLWPQRPKKLIEEAPGG